MTASAEPTPGSASDPQPTPTSTSAHAATSPPPELGSSWIADWLGIWFLILLWGLLVALTLHIVVIPRAPGRCWPAWLPLVGGLRSSLPEDGLPGRDALFTIPANDVGLALALLGVAMAPLVLSFGAGLIAKWQQAPRARHRFLPECDKGAVWTEREREWKQEAAERIKQMWVIEARRALQAQHRMMQHACQFGCGVSTVLCWALIISNSLSTSTQVRMLAIAAASAAITSFALSFGRITVRASIRDTSARMFAFALRAVVTSVLGVLLLCTLLWHNRPADTGGRADRDGEVLKEQPLKNPASFLMIGMVVALIGESVLHQLTARAAGVLNLSSGRVPSEGAASLTALEGMSEQDLIRLGEEGVDSLHALAMASTAYLYFSTPYTLQRLCDWQDQALLITNVGFAKAQACREKLMIRGAMDLQRKADFLVSARGESPQRQAENEKTFEIIRSSLGFISVEQARESLFPVANDETIRRLRIYERGSVVEELPRELA
jgi:hypothetical protein